MVRRRQLLSGAFAASLAATAHAKPAPGSPPGADRSSLRDYGAVGDGTADDTAAVQAALDAAADGRLIVVPQGKFRITAPLRGKGRLNLLGFSAQASEFLFDRTARFDYDGGSAGDDDASQITIRNIGFRCAKSRPRSSGAVLAIRFADGAGHTAKSAIIEDIEISGASGDTGFDCGIRLSNATNLKIDGARIRGARLAREASIGIDIGGDASPVDMFLSNISCYFLHRAIHIGGTVEGVHLSHSVFVAVDHGVYARPPRAHPLLFVHNCHINAFRSCVDLLNIVQFDVSHNLFYASKPRQPLEGEDAAQGFVAIRVAMHDDIGLDSRICDNTIVGTTPIDIPKNGIYVDGEKSEFSLSVSGNELVGWDTAVILGSGANGVFVSASNRFRSNRTSILDMSGRNGVPSLQLEPVGHHRAEGGVETKWGTSAVVLDANGRGSIVLSPPFKSRLLFGMATNADAASSAPVNFVVDASASGVGEMRFAVIPHAAAGTNVRLNWVAIGC